MIEGIFHNQGNPKPQSPYFFPSLLVSLLGPRSNRRCAENGLPIKGPFRVKNGALIFRIRVWGILYHDYNSLGYSGIGGIGFWVV